MSVVTVTEPVVVDDFVCMQALNAVRYPAFVIVYSQSVTIVAGAGGVTGLIESTSLQEHTRSFLHETIAVPTIATINKIFFIFLFLIINSICTHLCK